MSSPVVSIVVPVFNEAGAAASLAQEISAAFGDLAHEIIFVDDASRDDTVERLVALKPQVAALRVLRHATNAGQSRAVRTGVLAARAGVVVTLDGDGQNDPADAPRLVKRLLEAPDPLALIGGRRVGRKDTVAKRAASKIGNGVRKMLLHDDADDTGCGLKAFRREAFLRLPYFDHVHRYLPALFLREGFEIAFEDVSHRPRLTGVSKYSNLGRLWVSVSDLLGVIWLRSRARSPGAVIETV